MFQHHHRRYTYTGYNEVNTMQISAGFLLQYISEVEKTSPVTAVTLSHHKSTSYGFLILTIQESIAKKYSDLHTIDFVILNLPLKLTFV